MTPSARRLPPESRRRQIVEHALELFADRGPAELRFDELARALQVSRGLLYHYFPGRVPDLYLAALELALDRGMTLLGPSPGVTPDGDPAGFAPALEQVITSPDFALVMRARASTDPRVHSTLDSAREEMVGYIARTIFSTEKPEPTMAVAIGSYFPFVDDVIRQCNDRTDISRPELLAFLARSLEALVVAATNPAPISDAGRRAAHDPGPAGVAGMF